VTHFRIMVCGAVALAASAVLAPAALAVGERLIIDGCDVGSGNDIHSLESHYDADRDEIVVALRLCNDVESDATYRVHLDHAAPFVEDAEALASCNTPADSAVARTPDGHKGVGTSEVAGNVVNFVVPLDDLDVGAPEEVPLIPLWATSRLGGTVDHAPNRETGDRCAHPQARSETLVQPRINIENLAFVSSFRINGAIGVNAGDAISHATSLCTQDAHSAGITDTAGIVAWLSTSADDAKSRITNPNAGPILTANGTSVVVDRAADLTDCNKGPTGDLCLLAPIDLDITGKEVAESTWSGTLPDGTADTPNCADWTSNSNNDQGSGGGTGLLDKEWTTGVQGSCDQGRRLICFLLQSG
jgi:hypothetical protein